MKKLLQALDVLLGQLQDDSVPLADLQRNHARASIYLDRCDLLLSQVEQSVRQARSEYHGRVHSRHEQQ